MSIIITIEPPVIDFDEAAKVGAAAMAEMRELMDPNSPYQQARQKALKAVPLALHCLGLTDVGRQALADFRTMLANGGRDLDWKNWAALAALLRGGLSEDDRCATENILVSSERGLRAGRALIPLWHKGGYGLDGANRQALVTLCMAEGAGV